MGIYARMRALSRGDETGRHTVFRTLRSQGHEGSSPSHGTREICFNRRDCFGRVSMNGAQFCILNVQYTKEEYFKKMPEFTENI